MNLENLVGERHNRIKDLTRDGTVTVLRLLVIPHRRQFDGARVRGSVTVCVS
jgi:hypothetical protein